MKTLENKLSEIRIKISGAIDTRNSIKNSAPARIEVEAKIDQFITRQSSEFRALSKVFASRGSAPIGIYAPTEGGGANVAPMLCYLFPEQTRAKLIEELDAEHIQYGLKESEWSAKQSELVDEILALEIQEESIVTQLRDNDVACERRNDIQNPVVIALKANAEYRGVQ